MRRAHAGGVSGQLLGIPGYGPSWLKLGEEPRGSSYMTRTPWGAGLGATGWTLVAPWRGLGCGRGPALWHIGLHCLLEIRQWLH